MSVYSTWNGADKSAGITLSGGDLVATETVGLGRSVRSTLSKSTGKWYWEITITTVATACRVGIATSAAGINSPVGEDAYGWGYNSNGYIYTGGTPLAYGNTFTTGDVIGIAMDLNNGKLWFSKNGTWQGSGDPVAGTNPAYSSLSGTLFSMFSGWGGVGTANFGATSLTYTPPTGFNSGLYEGDPLRELTAAIAINMIAVSPTFLKGMLNDIQEATISISPSISGTMEYIPPPEITAAISFSPSVTGTMSFGANANAAIDLPMVTLSATGLIAVDGVAYPVIPILLLDATGHDSSLGNGSPEIPSLTLTGVGRIDELGNVSISLPSLLLSAQGNVDEVGNADLTLPHLTASITAHVGEVGNLSKSLPSLTLSIAAAIGVTGDTEITIPMLTLSSTGLLSVEGTAELTLPALTLFSEIATAAASYQNMAMNIRNNALSTYTNYPFNSFCRFNGVNLGATSTKIYNLVTGTTDNGTAISWSFKTAFLDLEFKTKKKLRLAWLTLKTDGNLTLTVSYPDGTSYDYTATSYETTEDGIRVKFGKGIASRYVALEIKNVSGSTLELDAIRLQLDQYLQKR